MKKLLTGALALLLPIAALATTLNPVGLLNPTGSTSGQVPVSTGPTTAPTWGNVAATALAAQAANTVVANVTASSASPTAFAMPSCSTSASALNWTSGTGFTCNSAINAATLGGATFAAPGPIGSTTASTGSFTTLAASSTVSGTGFSTYLASPPAIGTTTPAAGKFTTLQATSTITPSSTAGIVGTTTNDNANAGSIGEVISSSVASPGVSLTSSVSVGTNVTSISLTAGDWDVWGNIYPVPNPSTVLNVERGTITTSSASIGSYGDPGSLYLDNTAMPAGNATSINVMPVILKLASTTTVYLVTSVNFTVSTCTAFGQIFARRRR